MLTAASRSVAKGGDHPMAGDGWMDKQNMAYTPSALLFGLKREGSSDMCCNTDETQAIMLSKVSQSQKDTV